MRVLMQHRPTLFTHAVSGDTTQVLNTKKYLERKGIRVDLSSRVNVDLREYDLVHLFGTLGAIESTYPQFLNAKGQNKPMVLSTIYWSQTELDQYKAQFPASTSAAFGKGNKEFRRFVPPFFSAVYSKYLGSGKEWALSDLFRYHSTDHLSDQEKRKSVIEGVDVLLPNSKIEEEHLINEFACHVPRVIVPNAVDASFEDAKPDWFIERYKLSGFALCAASVSERKNQLGVIRALKETGIKIVFIGGAFNYKKRCLEEAGPDVLFLDSMVKDQLSSAYAAAKVHVLASYYETPGLASLEAALAGCQIVTTDRGSTREYFQDYAYYCDPSNLVSIREAVLMAFQSRPNPEMREYIKSHFTWEKAAEMTMKGYEMALKFRAGETT